METLTLNGNLNNNSQRPHPNKSRSNFSQAAVNKSDVGDFQAGYFVMADMPQPKPKTHHNINSEKRNTHRPPVHPPHAHPHHPHPQRVRSTTDLEIQKGDTNVSHGRLQTSPHRSPTRTNKRNSHSPPQHSHPQSHHHHIDKPMSPHKPRKAPLDRDRDNVSPQRDSGSSSPPKEKGPSPTPNRWAGPAFSNAPPPSSLPLPDFPPFSLSVSPVSSSPPSSSPLSSSPPESSSASVIHYQEQFFVQPPLYPAPYPHFNAHFSFAEAPAHYGYNPPSLVQLSTDLRRMLNIVSDPVLA